MKTFNQADPCVIFDSNLTMCNTHSANANLLWLSNKQWVVVFVYIHQLIVLSNI